MFVPIAWRLTSTHVQRDKCVGPKLFILCHTSHSMPRVELTNHDSMLNTSSCHVHLHM